MSDAEMNKKMEFIVEQQAKFAADIEIMREIQAADAKRLGDGLMGVIDIVGQLAQSQLRTQETGNTLTRDVNGLAQPQAHTRERLTILINACWRDECVHVVPWRR